MSKRLIEEAIEFHGHLCPGIAFGCRAALYACRQLNIEPGRLQDSHIVVAENDLCGLDGIQYITGCTIGNDGLVIRNIGKQAFNFISKKTGQGIRVVLNVPLWESAEPLLLHAKVKNGKATEQERKDFIKARFERGQKLLDLPDEQLLKLTPVAHSAQERVRLFPSVKCSLCQEAVMEPYVSNIEGNHLCQDCNIYEKIRNYMRELCNKQDLSEKNIKITGTILSVHEAIGSPARKDFPLQKGKEKLVQAEIDGFLGQAFTDMPKDFSGKLEEVIALPLDNNYRRAIFFSTLNSLMAKLGLIDHTIHCRDEGPTKCAAKLAAKISEQYGNPHIALFGLQPAIADALSQRFKTRIFDLDPDNIGKEKFMTTIENGDCDLSEVEEWTDLFLVTGSTIINGTLIPFLRLKKPVIYYGTSIAGAAKILGLERFCAESL